MAVRTCDPATDSRGREMQPHGTKAFPCACYEETYSAGPEHTLPWHWHPELEVIFIKEGAMRLRIPGEEILIRAGETAVINSDVLHSGAGAPECLLRSFVVSPEFIAGSRDSVLWEKYMGPLTHCPEFRCILLHAEGQSSAENSSTGKNEPEEEQSRGKQTGEKTEAAAFFETAFSAFQEETPGFEFAVRGALSELVLAVFRRIGDRLQAPEKAAGPDEQRMEKMLQFIHEHYADDVSLADIARVPEIGERECLRCFRRVIGESPMQYLLKYRLMQSAAMLNTRPDLSVAEIAAACGFASPGYFTRQFRKIYGVTPRDYRNRADQSGRKNETAGGCAASAVLK